MDTDSGAHFCKYLLPREIATYYLIPATVVMGGSAIGTIFVFFVSPLIISSNLGIDFRLNYLPLTSSAHWCTPGWRAVFYLHGLIALTWAAGWLFLVNRSAGTCPKASTNCSLDPSA